MKLDFLVLAISRILCKAVAVAVAVGIQLRRHRPKRSTIYVTSLMTLFGNQVKMFMSSYLCIHYITQIKHGVNKVQRGVLG